MLKTLKTVATVNGVEIQIIDDGEKRVAVRTICDALGVSYQAQIDKLKSDPKWNSTVMLSITVGADGKQREMVTIPVKKVFGWLYSINANNVKEESREALLRYQEECNDALFNYFARKEQYLTFRQQKMNESMARKLEAKHNFASAKDVLYQAEANMKHWFEYTEEDYAADLAQLEFEFNKEGE